MNRQEMGEVIAGLLDDQLKLERDAAATLAQVDRLLNEVNLLREEMRSQAGQDDAAEAELNVNMQLYNFDGEMISRLAGEKAEAEFKLRAAHKVIEDLRAKLAVNPQSQGDLQ